jgi:2,4-dienoyl-CoA reductase-like NADH-dependent reductase (Old Yellow Enzyme family)
LPQDFPLGVRISFTDYVENGWDLKQSIELAKEFKKLGVDFVDCSSGGVSAHVIYHASMNNVDQIPAAEAIQKEAGIATAAVGKIVDPFWAEQILQERKATLIMIGRAFLDDPNWPLHAAFELGADHQFKLPNQYVWAIGANTAGKWRQTVLKDRNNNNKTK